MNEIHDAMERGDVPALVRAMIRGIRYEEEGVYCQCAVPDIERGGDGRGRSIICFACGLANLARKQEVEAAMAAPHPFRPMGDRLILNTFCGFCTMTKNDPRHTTA